MKRFVSLIPLTLLLCVLLSGCSNGYYGTPQKAYLQDLPEFGENEFYDDVGAEIDCITLTDSEAIWFAVVNGDSIIHARMNVKNGKFRRDGGATLTCIPDLENLQDRPMLKDLSYYGCISDTGRHLYYSFVLTELLPEIDEEHDYTIEHYTVPVNGEDTDLTLVYYFE